MKNNIIVQNIIVPEGKIVDFIDGSFRNDTPEEYVRQQIEKSLVKEYVYPKNLCTVEHSIKVGSSRKRADIVIFETEERQKAGCDKSRDIVKNVLINQRISEIRLVLR
ncbi:unnamed protein product [marine sediment metagenome]|uniref:Type I restriction enzyme R protein N-terminal domain-containing protein n=1 Tax=marine sediment metagenome TaxID=412755 RepID=X1GUG9_9ZZZZ